MTVRILKLRYEHIPGLIEVWKEFMDYHARIHPHFMRAEQGHIAFEKHARENMKSRDYAVFVALDGEKVIGYTLLQTRKPPPVYDEATFGFLSDIAVKEEYRRQGVGERLLKRALRWFKDRGIKWIELSVVYGNPSGYPFWKKQGFKPLMHRMYFELLH